MACHHDLACQVGKESTALTWYEPHVERSQALAVVDGVAGPVRSGQPLPQGADGISEQELGRQAGPALCYLPQLETGKQKAPVGTGLAFILLGGGSSVSSVPPPNNTPELGAQTWPEGLGGRGQRGAASLGQQSPQRAEAWHAAVGTWEQVWA